MGGIDGFCGGRRKSQSQGGSGGLQASDYLTRLLSKNSAESLAWGDVLRQSNTKRLAESLPMSETPQRGVTKNAFEAFGLGDDWTG